MTANTIHLLVGLSITGLVISAATLGIAVYAGYKAKKVADETKQKITAAKSELKKFMTALEDL